MLLYQLKIPQQIALVNLHSKLKASDHVRKLMHEKAK